MLKRNKTVKKMPKTKLGKWYKARSKVAKVFIWLGAIIVAAVAGMTILSLTASPIGGWRNPAGRQEYESAYNEALKKMPAYDAKYDIKTDFGTVRAYRWSTPATANKTPIVLLPGRTSGVPMWNENIVDLMQGRPVYALDALGDSGLSVQTKKIAGDADQARWLDQTLAGLKLSKVNLVGHSFGGWSAANYAARYPDRVATLSLLEPVRVFTDMHLSIYISSIPASLPFLPQSWRDQFLEKVGGSSDLDPNDPLTRMISAATNSYKSALPFPGMISQQQLQAWPMPVYVAMGANSAMHDSAKAVHIAQQNIRNVQAKNWPGGTHSLPMEQSAVIDASMLEFMAKADAN